MNRWLTRLICALALGAPAALHAQDRGAPAAHFSDQGRILVAGTVNGHYAPKQDGDWAIQIEPSTMYFVRQRIGVGISPGYATGREVVGLGSTRFHQVGLAASALFDLPIGERLSLLVRPSLGYAYRKTQPQDPGFLPQILLIGPQNRDALVKQATGSNWLTLGLHLPVVYHASSSLVFGLGPYVAYRRLVGAVHYAETGNSGPNGSVYTIGPTANNYEVGLSSFIGASF